MRLNVFSTCTFVYNLERKANRELGLNLRFGIFIKLRRFLDFINNTGLSGKLFNLILRTGTTFFYLEPQIQLKIDSIQSFAPC